MTEYLYASPSHKVAFAGAPDDATHVIKLEGVIVWAKLTDNSDMACSIGGGCPWRELTIAELEEYELVAERTPIQQPTTRRPEEGSELKWEYAPDGAEFKLKNRTNGSLAWGKNKSDDYIAVASQHSDDWYSFSINDWEIISHRVPVTIATPTPYKPAPYEPTLLEAHSGGWGFKAGQQFQGHVVAYHADWVWFVVDGVPKPITTRLDKVTFTKPLTPEEQARIKAVSELADLIAYHVRRNPIDKLSEEDIANDIISAGYRKGENTL